MRVLVVVGVALGGAVGVLSAQHAHQIEFGAFGTYNHYDPLFNLNSGVGVGGRVGFFFNDFLGLEVSGSTSSASSSAGTGLPSISVRPLDLNLVLNSGGEHNILYVLAGVSDVKMGTGGLNALHGAIGDRIFFSNRAAVRLEGGAYFAPNQAGLGKSTLQITASAGLSLFLLGSGGAGEVATPELTPQERDSILAAGGKVPPTKPSRQIFLEQGLGWTNQWFWGAEAGILVFKQDFDGVSAEPTFGGHWLITAKRTALYVGYDQAFFLSARHETITEPSGTIEPGNVAFNSVRRIMAGVLAFPAQKAVQPFGGAGFAIMEVLNPVITCTGCSTSDAAIVQNEALDDATKAFFWWMVGVDVRQGRLALFAHYILTTHPANFLLDGVTQTFEGGLRYSLGSAKDEPNDQH